MTANEKTYTVESREMLYEGRAKDSETHPGTYAEVWYEGNDKAEALRIATKYAADTCDTGEIEVCKNGIARNVFEVFEVVLDEDGDTVDEDTVEIVDPLDRMPKLREFADKADSIKCQLPSYITGESKWIDDIEINGKVYGLYRFELSAFGEFSAYTENCNLWLPATFGDYGIKSVEQLEDAIKNERGEWWQDWQTESEYDGILYKLFAAEV